jgi:DNA-binding winged helix-turn-helix (wHTH) protein
MGGVNALKLSKEIGKCYRLAAETREKASAHADPVIRQHYLDMEQRWLLLAHSYTFLERLTAFTAAKPRGRKRRLDEIIRPGHLLQGTDAFPEDALDEQKLLDRLSPPAASPGSKGDEDVPAPVKIEDCKLDLAAHTFVDGSGREVRLTRAETALLTAFVHSPRRALSRDQLRYAVAGRGAEPHDRSVDMLVARLRRKIEPDPKTPRFILSMPGVGYKFDVRPQSAANGEAP